MYNLRHLSDFYVALLGNQGEIQAAPPYCQQQLWAPVPCRRLLSFIYWALSGWVRLWRQVCLYPSCSNGCQSCSIVLSFPAISGQGEVGWRGGGSAAMRRGERRCLFSGTTASASLSLQAQVQVLQPDSSTTALTGVLVNCICSDCPNPSSCQPLLLISICPPSDFLFFSF